MQTQNMLTALIVDDEPLARTHLRRSLEELEVQVIAEAGTAVQALQQVEDLHPDLLFLDIRMPGLDGLQAAGALLHQEASPLVVFVTGYSEHAVAAFEQNALDYLVKPVAPDRLVQTLMRARERLTDNRLRKRAREQAGEPAETVPPALQRLPVREDYTVRLLRVEEILCAVARNKRVFIRTREGEYRTYYTLTQLETLLPADRFLRIHDSCLIHLGGVEALLFLGNHSYMVRMSDDTTLPVGRSRYAELQRRLGLNPVTPS
ncbi:MAG TPA: LytTR family DNA-binding domain-containing protein [Chthonomonadaceae bacterium]|nr:LytTR family DNA-binding domain-containing protein [Chthonomonadaceae bacterium]